MGAYVNLTDGTDKCTWLEKNGMKISAPTPSEPVFIVWGLIPEGKMIVCLIDNGPFKAAGIAFNKGELEEFMINDGRLKEWYLVDIDKLHTVSSELASYMKRGG